MSTNTEQMSSWMGEFGLDYTNRNPHNIDEMEQAYRNCYDITRTELNNSFVGEMKRNMKILEVGSNTGVQLMLLREMGFMNLYGIEINSYAIECSKANTKGINIIQGSAFDIPFKNGFFDMVFTSGVLIHIHPKDINKALTEMYRCSSKYIWGFEYYADTYTEIVYRRHNNLLWKTNFAGLYLDLFDDLELVKELRVKYLQDENEDEMFLIKQGDRG